MKIHTLLIDTCVWLDLAKDTTCKPLIMALKNLLEDEVIRIIIPTIVKEEFLRNKERVIDIGKQKLSQDFHILGYIMREHE